jgi:hypothetical protein
MRIATFGSCLSLRIADQYRAANGGDVVSCVYHNRSDQFLGRFVDGSLDELSYDRIRHATGVVSGSEEDAILRNQCRGTMGSHLLKRWTPFLDALDEKSIDLLLVDNFMDASAALRSIGGGQFFSRVAATEANGMRIMPKLTPEQSAANFSALLRHFRRKLPSAAIVFTAFPWNTYPDKEQRRVWESRFSADLKSRGVAVIPTKIVPDKLKGEAPSHYQREMYRIYASDVRQIVLDHERRKHQPKWQTLMEDLQQGMRAVARAAASTASDMQPQ